MRWLVVVGALALGACDGRGQPMPECREDGLGWCAAQSWLAFCSGGYDPETPFVVLPGTTFPACDTGIPACPDGSEPYCEADPWEDDVLAYVDCYDRDGDGEVYPDESPLRDDGQAVCAPDFGWRCEDDAGNVLDDYGFSCTTAHDPGNIAPQCGVAGEPARCVRTDGPALPEDFEVARCRVPLVDALALCGS